MATPLLYTSCEAVRACLGLDPNDCPDRVLIDSNLELELELDLDSWVTTHNAINNANVPGATTQDRRRGNLLTLYCQWFCAAQVARRHLLFLQVSADGKNRAERFEVDFDAMAVMAEGLASKYKTELGTDLEPTTTGPVLFGLAAASVPDLDPITEVPE